VSFNHKHNIGNPRSVYLISDELNSKWGIPANATNYGSSICHLNTTNYKKLSQQIKNNGNYT